MFTYKIKFPEYADFIDKIENVDELEIFDFIVTKGLQGDKYDDMIRFRHEK